MNEFFSVFVNYHEQIVFGIPKSYEQIVFSIFKFYEWIVFGICKYLGPNTTDIFLFKGIIYKYFNIFEPYHAVYLNTFISRFLHIHIWSVSPLVHGTINPKLMESVKIILIQTRSSISPRALLPGFCFW